MVLAALDFVEHCGFILAGEHRLQVDPATVQVTADTGRGFRIATEAAHLLLQFRGSGTAFASTLDEVAFQLGILHILGRGFETLFAILAELDQFVENRDDFFVGGSHDIAPLHEGRCNRSEQGSCQPDN
ncbi:hypothetical protein D9M71_659080 [compost metagenome]